MLQSISLEKSLDISFGIMGLSRTFIKMIAELRGVIGLKWLKYETDHSSAPEVNVYVHVPVMSL